MGLLMKTLTQSTVTQSPATPQHVSMSLEHCLVTSSTDVNNNLTSAYSRSPSSSSDCVTSSSDYRLTQERTNLRENQTPGESVSSTTAEAKMENKSLMEELIIELIH